MYYDEFNRSCKAAWLKLTGLRDSRGGSFRHFGLALTLGAVFHATLESGDLRVAGILSVTGVVFALSGTLKEKKHGLTTDTSIDNSGIQRWQRINTGRIIDTASGEQKET